MLARAFHVEVKSLMSRRRLLSCLKESAFNNDATVRHLTDAREEVFRLDFTSHHLWVVVYFYLFRKDATPFVFFLNKLVTHLERVHVGLVLPDHLGLVLLQGQHDSLVSNFASLQFRQTLLDSLFARLVSRLHGNLGRS